MAGIRWGVLSTARINDALIGPLQESGRSELVAVASRDADRARAYAAQKGIPRAYGRYEDLIADPEIDVIYNPLPNHLHREWTIRAAEAGKHVLCEKPMVPTLDELDQIEAAARANHVTVFEGYMYLHHPQTLKVKHMIEAGQLGRLKTITAWFSFYLPPENTHDFRLHPEMSGGAMWDVGVYPNSLALVLAGDGLPEEVWARQIVGPTGVDVSFDAQMRFRSGTVAQLTCSFQTPVRDGAHIAGDKGTIYLSNPWRWRADQHDRPSKILFSTIDGDEETIMLPPVSPYLCEVQAMEACILDGAAPVVPLSQSRELLTNILALYESAGTGRVVRVR